MCDVKERKALSTPQGPYYIRNIVLFFRIGWLFVNGMIISGSVKTKCWRLKCPNMFKYLPRIRNTQQINYFINCASPASKTCYISCALSHLTHCLVSNKGVKKISRWFSQFWERFLARLSLSCCRIYDRQYWLVARSGIMHTWKTILYIGNKKYGLPYIA